MIRHIFKIIWNERRINAWILVEFILVFCILWFCTDFLYYLAGRKLEPLGFDINHTYMIRMAQKEPVNPSEDEQNAYAETLKQRVLQYPGVENIAFASSAIPFGGSSSAQGFNVNRDSLNISIRIRWATPEFFDVFRIKFLNGSPFEGGGMSGERKAVISIARDGRFGWGYQNSGEPYDIQDVKTLYAGMNDENPYTVVGAVAALKDSRYAGYNSSVVVPLGRNRVHLVENQIVIRVSDAADTNFADRFLNEMKEQLMIGPYLLFSIESLQSRADMSSEYEVGDNLNSVLSITAFLLVNIFLGILGTFWSRIQTRRSEIGLRIALGASQKKVKRQLTTETFLLLFVSSIVGTIICLNIGQTELLDSLGIPTPKKDIIETGIEQYFINFGLTFGFLAAVSFLSVWYPARKAAKIQPAEALRNE